MWNDARAHRQSQKSQFIGSAQGFAFCLALALTALAAPALYDFSADHVLRWAEQLYGYQYSEYVLIGWAILVGPLVFFAVRGSLTLSLISAALVVAQKFII